ncbi:family 43 glycosylhydrolase [Reichenbachiella agariperforans]|uniref:family 43 glycosylhydrolase n=1 Tax=Reichenbachiella agariperforans TaxID=156994 RepID=UPI001C0A40B0|nr:family 43 glycosylhydrolase [Reichenbachiella agariperforans]MBU2913518.1 family 43 glycosylhydrolase [Reichenbachiella agariperforans]
MKVKRGRCILGAMAMLLLGQLNAQNPLIQDQFTADPSARVFGDKVYVFPSHDILAEEGKGRVGWFCMEDYHVFSSADLTNWTDHGMIVSQENVAWADPKGYSMWAPDCIERNGKYYFYSPTKKKDAAEGEGGFTVGVAVADSPEGPYAPEENPIEGIKGIDPNVFIDDDGQAYLYWSRSQIYGAPLKENMLELAAEPTVLGDLPQKGHKEGPYMIKRNGVYYLTYPHVENKTERLEYATGDSPLGSFTVQGVIMDESPTGCWTNHHSIINYKGQYLLFYHHNELSPQFDKSRSIMADSLFFEPDGKIRKVTPTLRGIGNTIASDKIQIDRYSSKSDDASISFNDSTDTFQGWYLNLSGKGSWVQYNSVDFSKTLKAVQIKAHSSKGAVLEIRTTSDALLAIVKVSGDGDWQQVEEGLETTTSGLQNLKLVLKKGDLKVDWVRFE